MKEYLEKQTSDNYVSKADAAVQDGAVVKAANTIGDSDQTGRRPGQGNCRPDWG